MPKIGLIEFGEKFLPNFKLLPYQRDLLLTLKSGKKLSLLPPRIGRRFLERLAWSRLLLNPPDRPVIFSSKERAEAFMRFAKEWNS